MPDSSTSEGQPDDAPRPFKDRLAQYSARNPSETGAQRPSLGALLVNAGYATDEQVQDALAQGMRTGERLGEVVIRTGLSTEEQLAELLAEQWQLPFLKAESVAVDPVAMQRVTLATARELGTLPIGIDEKGVVLAIGEPTQSLFDTVGRVIGEASFVVVARSALDPLLKGRRLTDPAVDGPELNPALPGGLEVYDPPALETPRVYDPSGYDAPQAHDSLRKDDLEVYDPPVLEVPAPYDPPAAEVSEAYDPPEREVSEGYKPPERELIETYDPPAREVSEAYDPPARETPERSEPDPYQYEGFDSDDEEPAGIEDSGPPSRFGTANPDGDANGNGNGSPARPGGQWASQEREVPAPYEASKGFAAPVGVRGSVEIEAVLGSIDNATGELRSIHAGVTAVGSSLAHSERQLAVFESELAAAQDAHKRDESSLRRLESELEASHEARTLEQEKVRSLESELGASQEARRQENETVRKLESELEASQEARQQENETVRKLESELESSQEACRRQSETVRGLESALEASNEARRQEETIRGLESELAHRGELFDALRNQVARLTETLSVGPER